MQLTIVAFADVPALYMYSSLQTRECATALCVCWREQHEQFYLVGCERGLIVRCGREHVDLASAIAAEQSLAAVARGSKQQRTSARARHALVYRAPFAASTGTAVTSIDVSPFDSAFFAVYNLL